nr:spike protein [Hipposideros bat coronavirus]
MISLAVYIAEILVIIINLPGLHSQSCNWNANTLPNLDLGLPGNSNAFVSGYLPQPNNWICKNGLSHYENIHGFFWSYYAQAQPVEIGVSNADQLANPNQWALYVYHANQYGYMHFKICKWSGKHGFNNLPQTNNGLCLVNRKFSFGFGHLSTQVVGVTWSDNFVTLYSLKNVYRFHLVNNWSRLSVRCVNSASCAINPVYNISTFNVSTNANGLILSYSVCTECDGFPQHVFPVLDGGKIPGDFDFSNWFVLTNTSTILQGRILAVQPLRLLCLWPVPSLTSNDKPIYFNLSQTEDARCNGYKTNGMADFLRFSLNFTQNQVLNGVHNIIFNTAYNNYTFTCTNDTSVTGKTIVPFGVLDQPYRCFVHMQTYNGSSNTFVGVLPPVTREFVVSRFGTVYVNGVRMMTLPPLESVIFNVTSSVGSDFWTVAFANDAQVMLDINATNIVGMQYCDTDIEKLKCQQLSFTLKDGFYTANSIARNEVPRSYVALPYHGTHTNVELNVTLQFKENIITLGENRSICVNTTQFTTVFNTNDGPDAYHGSVENVDCPFTFHTLNNYLTFDSLCLSLDPMAGACTMSIDSVILGYHQPIGVLYVTHTAGSKIHGMPQETGGIYDSSSLVTDICTDYTIYGVTGRGVITLLNTTIVSGLYYTSPSGQLLGFKNATNGDVYSVRPCDLSSQAAVYEDQIVGVVSASANISYGFNQSVELPNFYYHSNSLQNCTDPVLTYGSVGICSDGSITQVHIRTAEPNPITPIVTGNISIPTNFSMSVQVEYLQMHIQPVSVDCSMYVCNGNAHCLRLLSQYVSACKNIEDALQLSARLESMEVNNAITVSDKSLQLANISNFDNYNVSMLLPRNNGAKSVVEDLLFNKVVTSGLGTVDQDYKKCIKDSGLADVADTACAQYYNGVMVLPGVVDDTKMGLYTASLVGGMVLGGFTAAAAIPFSIAVQSRLNYVALQTDVLQKNQQILADSFNNAMSNITLAFTEVNNALQETSSAINTVAEALNKVQSVVNQQGEALSQLTQQLSSNFQAISNSIEDIYNRLDGLAADAQVDRLISGRLSALNAFVTQTLTKYTDVRASRQLALQKINECVKSQSNRYGFCGNGTHVFSIPNAAPNGIMFFHTVLVPTTYTTVQAWAGLCVSEKAFVLRDVKNTLFRNGESYYITPRDMYEPRTPVFSDFVQITDCSVTYLNLTSSELNQVIPDYIDVNKTLEDFAQMRPNFTVPDYDIGVYNHTILNLTTEIETLQNKSDQLLASTVRLQELIDNLNKTYVDLEWLNRFEQYIKWPWYVWLLIFLAIILFSFLMLYCCCATGCCGCLSCLSSSCDCRGSNLQRYEVEKVHIQ